MPVYKRKEPVQYFNGSFALELECSIEDIHKYLNMYKINFQETSSLHTTHTSSSSMYSTHEYGWIREAL